MDVGLDHPARASLLRAIGRATPWDPLLRVRKAPQRPLPPDLQGCRVTDVEIFDANLTHTAASQSWIPVRLVTMADPGERLRPAIVLLHPTLGDMDGMATKAADVVSRGHVAVLIDCRYHGTRSGPAHMGYQQALVAAWRGSGEHPFLLDNVRDLLTVADYLEAQGRALGVDAGRLAVTGVSLGGMHAWLWAAADPRVAAAAPIIGVQDFGYALQHDCFRPRAASLPLVFAAATADLGGPTGRLTPEIARAVWDKLLPGLLEEYDSPRSLAAIAPRPLLIVNGADDPRCPIQGVYGAVASALRAYEAAGAVDDLELVVEDGVGHECTPAMWQTALNWLIGHLTDQSPG